MSNVKLSTILIFVSLILMAFLVRPSFTSLVLILVNAGILFVMRNIAYDEAKR